MQIRYSLAGLIPPGSEISLAGTAEFLYLRRD